MEKMAAIGWQELGPVETIYEDDREEEDDASFTLSSSAATAGASPSPPPPPPRQSFLQRIVDKWSQVNGSKPDVVLRVQDQFFHLHKELLVAQSGYLRRELQGERADVVAVDLPAFIPIQAFSDAVASCYGAEVAVGPYNLLSLRAVADWLELADTGGMAMHDLTAQTEDYFFQDVATDAARATAVLRSCAKLLPVRSASKTAAELFARCAEVLSTSGGAADGAWLDVVAALPVEEFEPAVEAMRARFAHDHDLLYSIVDHYLEKAVPAAKLSDDEKARLCYSVDSTKLSQHHLMHLVQNPRLPLRFVVQAMLVEQLQSHHSILRSAALTTAVAKAAGQGCCPAPDGLTLGDILQRDAVLRQSAHIRASMQSTSQRIEFLEKELSGLRRRLRCTEDAEGASAGLSAGNARSASFRIFRRRGWDGSDVVSPADGNSSGALEAGRPAAPSIGVKLVQGIKCWFRRSGNGEGWKDGEAERRLRRRQAAAELVNC